MQRRRFVQNSFSLAALTTLGGVSALTGCATTGAVNFPQVEVPLIPGTHRILNVHRNTPGVLRKMAKIVQDLGVRPELEVFDFGHLVQVKEMIKDGLLDDPVMIQLCMGIPYGAPADPLMRVAALEAFLHPLTGTSRSLLQATVDRVGELTTPERTHVVTGVTHAAAARRAPPSRRRRCHTG